MNTVKIQKLSEEEINKRGVRSWPVWEKEESVFDWHYDSDEECYLLEGRVKVSTSSGDVSEFGAGDFVSFPEGMDCTWEVLEKVRKHYRLY